MMDPFKVAKAIIKRPMTTLAVSLMASNMVAGFVQAGTTANAIQHGRNPEAGRTVVVDAFARHGVSLARDNLTAGQSVAALTVGTLMIGTIAGKLAAEVAMGKDPEALLAAAKQAHDQGAAPNRPAPDDQIFDPKNIP